MTGNFRVRLLPLEKGEIGRVECTRISPVDFQRRASPISRWVGTNPLKFRQPLVRGELKNANHE